MKKFTLIFSITLMTTAYAVTTAQAQKKTGSFTSYTNDNDIEEINTYLDDKSYRMRLEHDKLVELYIDNKKIPAAEWPKYESMIQRLKEQMKKDRAQAEKDRIQAGKDRLQAEKDRAQAELDRQQAARDRIQADKDRARADLDRQQGDRDRSQAEKDRANAELDRQQAEKDRAQADKDRQQAQQDRIQAEKDRAQADIDRKKADADRKLVQSLVEDLVTQKILADKNEDYSIQLSDKSLVVNGKEQPATIHQQLKAKYLKDTSKNISIQRFNGNGMHMNIH